MQLHEALKTMRRNVFVHSDHWRTAVIAPNAALRDCAWDESKHLIEASSLGLVSMHPTIRAMLLERNAELRFFVVGDGLDVYKLAGTEWTQIIILQGDYPQGAMDYLRAMLRSAYIADDKLLWQSYVTV